MGKMKNQAYQMVTVCEYLNLLDSKGKYIDDNAQTLKANVEKYLLSMRRAKTNAKILESLLA